METANKINMGITLRDVQHLALELMNTQWDFEDLYGGPRSINIVVDLGYKFKFDNSKSRFGCCVSFRSNGLADTQLSIQLSKPLCSLNLDKLHLEIKNVILHEIAHALTKCVNPHADSHGRLWKHIARQIGCDATRCYDGGSVVQPKSKYTLTCPSCSRKVPAYKRPKREKACGVCCKAFNGGRFSKDYVLVLSQNY